MKSIEKRVEKLECAMASKDKPLKIILVKPGETRQEAVAKFHEQHPNVQGLIVIFDEVSK
jgi:stalled ribosome rescue protein Dom34